MSVAPPGLVAMPEFIVIVVVALWPKRGVVGLTARLLPAAGRRAVNIEEAAETLPMACERTGTPTKVFMGHSTDWYLATSHAMPRG